MCNPVGPQIVTAEDVFQFFKADEQGRSYFIVWSDGSVDRINLPDSRVAFCVAVTAKRIGDQNLREILNNYLTEVTPLKDGYIVNVARPTKNEYEKDSDPVTLARIERIELKNETNEKRTEIYWMSQDGNMDQSHAKWGPYEEHPYSPIIGVCYSILKRIGSTKMFGSWFNRLSDNQC